MLAMVYLMCASTTALSLNNIPRVHQRGSIAALRMSSLTPPRLKFTRRTVFSQLAAAAATTATLRPLLARAEEGGILLNNKQNTTAAPTMERLKLEEGSVGIPSTWERQDNGTFSDPSVGPRVDSIIATASPTKLSSVTDLGPVESVNLKVLGVRPELVKGDLVACAMRKAADGRVTYEWDLALSPKECEQNDRIIVGVCFPTELVLLSATVADGQLFILDVKASVYEWKTGANQLRSVRSSFELPAQAPQATSEPPAPEAGAATNPN